MRDNPPRAAPVQSVMPRGWDEGEGEGEGGEKKTKVAAAFPDLS